MQTGDAATDWLLESSIPTIRYQTLTRLLGCAPDDPQVVEARQSIMLDGPVPAILARQTERGDWAKEHSYYTPKYTSTHWSMQLLEELQADAADARPRRGVEFMLDQGLPWDKKNQKFARIDLECLYGNILRYAAYFGFAQDARALETAEFLARSGLEGG